MVKKEDRSTWSFSTQRARGPLHLGASYESGPYCGANCEFGSYDGQHEVRPDMQGPDPEERYCKRCLREHLRRESKKTNEDV